MVLQQALEDFLVGLARVPVSLVMGVLLSGGNHFVHRHHGRVATRCKLAVFVVHISHAAAHASCKVAAGFTQHGHRAARHVFAAMVARAFYHCCCAGKTHRKALACHAAQERLTCRGTVQHRVTDDGVLHSIAPKVNARAHHNAATAQALAGVVIGVANQVQGDAFGQESTKRLAPGAFKLNAQGVVWQAFGAQACQLARQHGTDGTVDVARHFNELDFFTLFKRGL